MVAKLLSGVAPGGEGGNRDLLGGGGRECSRVMVILHLGRGWLTLVYVFVRTR